MNRGKASVKTFSLALGLMLTLSLFSTTAFAQAAQGSEVDVNVITTIENSVAKIRVLIENSKTLTEDEKILLIHQLEVALELAKNNDINGAIAQIRNVTRELTIITNERTRERIRALVEERVRLMQQLRESMPEDVRAFLENTTKPLEDIRAGKVDVNEIHKLVRKITIVGREIKKAKEISDNVVSNITEDEETRKTLHEIMPHFAPVGLIALLDPADMLLQRAEKIITLTNRDTDLLEVIATLRQSIDYTKQAIEKFSEGDFTAFQEYLEKAKSSLQVAKEKMAEYRATPRKLAGAMGAYNMILTSMKMIEMTISSVEKVMGGILNENRVMVKGVVVSYDEESGIVIVLGSLHLVIKSPGERLRSAGYVPLIGSWTVKITNETVVNGTIEESAPILVLGRTIQEDGKVVVIADTIYANTIIKLKDIEKEIES